MLLPALALTVVMTQTDVSAQIVEPKAPPTLDVWMEPIPFAMMSVICSAAHGSACFYLPTGFTVAVGESWGISGELAGIVLAGNQPGWGLSTSLGPTWLPSGRGVQGWFVSPKLTLNITSMPTVGCFGGCRPLDANNGPIDLGVGVARSFLAGVDAGYQWTPGGFAIALLAGVSAGYGYDENASGLVTPLLSSTSTQRSQGPVWGLNLAVLRVGIAR